MKVSHIPSPQPDLSLQDFALPLCIELKFPRLRSANPKGIGHLLLNPLRLSHNFLICYRRKFPDLEVLSCLVIHPDPLVEPGAVVDAPLPAAVSPRPPLLQRPPVPGRGPQDRVLQPVVIWLLKSAA